MTCFKPEGSNRSRHHQVGDETTAGTGGVALRRLDCLLPPPMVNQIPM
jgi:hypothetical protein